jgi:hypothetical protein
MGSRESIAKSCEFRTRGLSRLSMPARKIQSTKHTSMQMHSRSQPEPSGNQDTTRAGQRGKAGSMSTNSSQTPFPGLVSQRASVSEHSNLHRCLWCMCCVTVARVLCWCVCVCVCVCVCLQLHVFQSAWWGLCLFLREATIRPSVNR